MHVLDIVTTVDDVDNAVFVRETLDTIGQQLLTLWQQVHGAPDGVVKVMAGQNGLMLLLENAFCRAELALAQQATDNLLQTYIDNLTDQILPILTDQIEMTTGLPVKATSITSNVSQNWIMVFLKFSEPDSESAHI